MVKGLSFKMPLHILKRTGVEHSQENGFGYFFFLSSLLISCHCNTSPLFCSFFIRCVSFSHFSLYEVLKRKGTDSQEIFIHNTQ
jgi:hypothetical protein